MSSHDAINQAIRAGRGVTIANRGEPVTPPPPPTANAGDGAGQTPPESATSRMNAFIRLRSGRSQTV